MGCCPFRTDPSWTTLRLQFSKCCCNMALYHGASHSGPQCSTQVPTGGSSPSPALLWAPQLQPEAAPVGALHVLCLLQASSAAAPRASLWLQVEICKQYPWTTGGTACYSTALSWAVGELLLCAWSSSCPSFCTDLGACRVCFSHIFHSSLPATQQFFPF